MWIKLFIVGIFLAILFSLGSALYYLLRDQGPEKRTVKALTWRIGLSLGLFGLLILGYFLGFLHPHGVMPM